MRQLLSIFFLLVSSTYIFCQDPILTYEIDSVFITDNSNLTKIKIPEFVKTGRLTLANYLSNYSSAYVHTSGPGLLSTIRIDGLEARHTSLNVLGINLNSPVNGVKDLNLINGILLNNLSIGNKSLSGGGSVNGWELYSSYNTIRNGHIDLNYTNNKAKLEYTASFAIDYNLNKFPYNLGANKAQRENSKFVNYTYSEKYKFIGKKSITELILYVQDSDRDISNSISSSYDGASQKDNNVNLISRHTRNLKRGTLELSGGYLFEKIDFSSFVVDTSVSKNNAFVLNTEWKKNYIKNTISLKLSNRFDRTNASFFTKKIDRLEQSLLLGIENYSISQLSLSASVMPRLLNTSDVFLDYKIKAKYDWNNIAIYGLYTQKNYLPTFNDLYWPTGGNENLQNELVKTFKIGLQYDISESVNVALSSFQSSGENWILWQPNNQGIWSPENINQVRNQGIDLSLSVKNIFKKYAIAAGLSYLDSRNTITDKTLIYRPHLKSFATLSYTSNRFQFSYNNSYTSRRFITSDNALQVEAYMLHNLSVEYSLSKFRFYLNVENLLNESYEVVPFFPMPLRNATFAASIKI